MRRETLLKCFLIVGIAFATFPVLSGITTRVDPVFAYSVHKFSEAASPGIVTRGARRHRPQDDRYDRRRAYWEERVERRMAEEESLDGDDEESNSNDSKQAKNKADDDDDESSADQGARKEHDEIEQRREYWRNRMEKEW
jgi:hypothetical protein